MLRKITALFLSLSLIITQPIFAQGVAQLNLAQYLGQARLSAIDNFRPTQLRYFSYDNLNDSFRILLDKGDAKDIKDNQLKQEAKELMDYFLIGLALPNDAFWVNLRPDSPDNIIDPELERTDLGKILLEADLQLKKDTAGLTSPQTPEGKAYWDKLYKKAGELFPAAGGSAFGGGTENITIPTITRPWIVPGEIIVRESGNSAYIYKATLKVLLEQDHLKDSSVYNFSDPRLKELNEYSSQIIKETIIPKLTQEVNSSKRYAQLRQVYYSLVLSRWFKQKYSSLRSARASARQGTSADYISLIDSGNLTNLTAKKPYDKLTYFKQYQESFAKGEYNLKEPVYTPYGQSIRTYMSGGFDGSGITKAISGANTKVAGSSLEQQLLNTENVVVFHNNFEIVKPEQPMTLAASPLTIPEMLALGIIPPQDFIRSNIATVLDRGFRDTEHLKAILEACKNYMLVLPKEYAEKAKIKISQAEIKEITDTASFYFNPHFTARPDNIAVAAGYLSGIMESKFNENIIAEGLKSLQEEIWGIVKQLHKNEENSQEGISHQEQSLAAMPVKSSDWKDRILRGFIGKGLSHDYLEYIFREYYKEKALKKPHFLWLKTIGIRVINNRYYGVVLERINNAGISITHRIFVESVDADTNVKYAIVVPASESESVEVITYYPSNKELEARIDKEFGELSPDVLEDFEDEVMSELKELASSAIKVEDTTIPVHKGAALPIELSSLKRAVNLFTLKLMDIASKEGNVKGSPDDVAKIQGDLEKLAEDTRKAFDNLRDGDSSLDFLDKLEAVRKRLGDGVEIFISDLNGSADQKAYKKGGIFGQYVDFLKEFKGIEISKYQEILKEIVSGLENDDRLAYKLIRDVKESADGNKVEIASGEYAQSQLSGKEFLMKRITVVLEKMSSEDVITEEAKLLVNAWKQHQPSAASPLTVGMVKSTIKTNMDAFSLSIRKTYNKKDGKDWDKELKELYDGFDPISTYEELTKWIDKAKNYVEIAQKGSGMIDILENIKKEISRQNKPSAASPLGKKCRLLINSETICVILIIGNYLIKEKILCLKLLGNLLLDGELRLLMKT